MKVFCIAKIDAKYVFVWLLGKVKVFYNDGYCRARRESSRALSLAITKSEAKVVLWLMGTKAD